MNEWSPDTTLKKTGRTRKALRVGCYKEIFMSDTAIESSSSEYEVTVSTPATTDQVIEYLRSNGFKGNVATNPNYPGVIWFGS
jgi:hypothetical protein